jgi:hypothetical protein
MGWWKGQAMWKSQNYQCFLIKAGCCQESFSIVSWSLVINVINRNLCGAYCVVEVDGVQVGCVFGQMDASECKHLTNKGFLHSQWATRQQRLVVKATVKEKRGSVLGFTFFLEEVE